ncbi:MAG: NADPH-dependent FMN reductase [Gemmatimonas sp.]
MSYSFLAVSGSLRGASVNGEVLKAINELSADDVTITQFMGIGLLPHFNPDHEANQPASVIEWRSALQEAQAVIICSPEYAHGVPGVLKNALDWVVGTGEFMFKPVALVNASPNSAFIVPQLSETLTVMMGNVHAVTLSMIGKKRDELSMRLDDTVSTELRAVLTNLIAAVDAARAVADSRA